MRLAIITVFLLLIGAQFAYSQVWTNQYQWDDRWESKYQNWVAKKWDRDFLFTKGFYKNLKVDCADAVYTMRYIFAAHNGLPFAIKDPTNPKKIFSNSNIHRWDSLPIEQRKRNFLRWLFGLVSTSSIPNDTYPVLPNRRGIKSGIVLRTDKKNHHSWTIKSISKTGIPFLVFASRPAKTKMKHRFEYPTTGFTFPRGLKPETKAGFMAFMQPKYLKGPVWNVPGYSLKQYDIPIRKWAKTLQSRLKVRNESPTEHIERLLQSVCIKASERVQVVNAALKYLKKIGSRCMKKSEYDDHSTPSRDKRLKGSFEKLANALSLYTPNEINSRILKQAYGIFKKSSQSSKYCPIKISSQKSVTLNHIYQAIKGKYLSNNPHDPRGNRWGLIKGSSKRARNCPIY